MYIMKYLKPYKWQAISGFIFKLIEAFLELCIPMAVALIIDMTMSSLYQYCI